MSLAIRNEDGGGSLSVPPNMEPAWGISINTWNALYDVILHVVSDLSFTLVIFFKLPHLACFYRHCFQISQ
jgi:hypothetical protein